MFVPDDRDIQRAIRNAQPVEIDPALQIPLFAQIRNIVTTTGLPPELLESFSPNPEAEKPEQKPLPSRTISQVMADLRRVQGIEGPMKGPVQAKTQNHYRPVSYNDYDSYEGVHNARPAPGNHMYGLGQDSDDDWYDD